MTTQFITASVTSTKNVGAQYKSPASKRALSIKKSTKTNGAFVVELVNGNGVANAVVIKGIELRDLIAKFNTIA